MKPIDAKPYAAILVRAHLGDTHDDKRRDAITPPRTERVQGPVWSWCQMPWQDFLLIDTDNWIEFVPGAFVGGPHHTWKCTSTPGVGCICGAV